MVKDKRYLCFSNDNTRSPDWALTVNALHRALFGDALPLVNKWYLEGSAWRLANDLSFRMMPEKFIMQHLVRSLCLDAYNAKFDIKLRVEALCAVIPQLRPWLSDCDWIINPGVKIAPIIRTGEISLL